jgi:hypothetical protein
MTTKGNVWKIPVDEPADGNSLCGQYGAASPSHCGLPPAILHQYAVSPEPFGNIPAPLGDIHGTAPDPPADLRGQPFIISVTRY